LFSDINRTQLSRHLMSALTHSHAVYLWLRPARGQCALRPDRPHPPRNACSVTTHGSSGTRPLSRLAVNFTAGLAFSRLISRLIRGLRSSSIGAPSLPFPSTSDQTHSRRGGVLPHCRRFFADHMQCITGLFLMLCVHCNL